MTESEKKQPAVTDRVIAQIFFSFLTAHDILQEQTPRKLMEVRSRIYELLTHCIPPDVIFV